MSDATVSMADDPPKKGVKAIAQFLGEDERRTQYLIDTRQIPAFKMGGRWYLRPSTYAAHIARLEEQAMKAARRWTRPARQP